MANNRLIAACVVCCEDEKTDQKDCVFYVARYYPSRGWDCDGDGSGMGREMAAFFEKHQHHTMWGDYIKFGYESDWSPIGDAKRNAVLAIAKTLVHDSPSPELP